MNLMADVHKNWSSFSLDIFPSHCINLVENLQVWLSFQFYYLSYKH